MKLGKLIKKGLNPMHPLKNAINPRGAMASLLASKSRVNGYTDVGKRTRKPTTPKAATPVDPQPGIIANRKIRATGKLE